MTDESLTIIGAEKITEGMIDLGYCTKEEGDAFLAGFKENRDTVKAIRKLWYTWGGTISLIVGKWLESLGVINLTPLLELMNNG